MRMRSKTREKAAMASSDDSPASPRVTRSRRLATKDENLQASNTSVQVGSTTESRLPEASLNAQRRQPVVLVKRLKLPEDVISGKRSIPVHLATVSRDSVLNRKSDYRSSDRQPGTSATEKEGEEPGGSSSVSSVGKERRNRTRPRKERRTTATIFSTTSEGLPTGWVKTVRQFVNSRGLVKYRVSLTTPAGRFYHSGDRAKFLRHLEEIRLSSEEFGRDPFSVAGMLKRPRQCDVLAETTCGLPPKWSMKLLRGHSGLSLGVLRCELSTPEGHFIRSLEALKKYVLGNRLRPEDFVHLSFGPYSFRQFPPSSFVDYDERTGSSALSNKSHSGDIPGVSSRTVDKTYGNRRCEKTSPNGFEADGDDHQGTSSSPPTVGKKRLRSEKAGDPDVGAGGTSANRSSVKVGLPNGNGPGNSNDPSCSDPGSGRRSRPCGLLAQTDHDLPPGWNMELRQRLSGSLKGSPYCVVRTPKGYPIRSLPDLRKYVDATGKYSEELSHLCFGPKSVRQFPAMSFIDFDPNTKKSAVLEGFLSRGRCEQSCRPPEVGRLVMSGDEGVSLGDPDVEAGKTAVADHSSSSSSERRRGKKRTSWEDASVQAGEDGETAANGSHSKTSSMSLLSTTTAGLPEGWAKMVLRGVRGKSGFKVVVRSPCGLKFDCKEGLLGYVYKSGLNAADFESVSFSVAGMSTPSGRGRVIASREGDVLARTSHGLPSDWSMNLLQRKSGKLKGKLRCVVRPPGNFVIRSRPALDKYILANGIELNDLSRIRFGPTSVCQFPAASFVDYDSQTEKSALLEGFLSRLRCPKSKSTTSTCDVEVQAASDGEEECRIDSRNLRINVTGEAADRPRRVASPAVNYREEDDVLEQEKTPLDENPVVVVPVGPPPKDAAISLEQLALVEAYSSDMWKFTIAAALVEVNPTATSSSLSSFFCMFPTAEELDECGWFDVMNWLSERKMGDKSLAMILHRISYYFYMCAKNEVDCSTPPAVLENVDGITDFVFDCFRVCFHL